MRYGSVPYLNAWPLLEGLREDPAVTSLECAVPAVLSERLAAGEIDVALCPIVTWLDSPGHSLVPGGCVSADGAVESVLLFTDQAPGACRTIGLDASSRTSVELLRVLLRHLWKAAPEMRTRPSDPNLRNDPADGILLIGDPALQTRRDQALDGGPPPVDLARTWRDWTGLPFVFAAWIATGPATAAKAQPVLDRARRRGLAALPEIARRGAAALELDASETLVYLRDRLSYDLGPRERAGIERFRELRRS